MVAWLFYILITSETVEKPKKRVLNTSEYLILLHANFTKMQELDFFDSLSIYLQKTGTIKSTDTGYIYAELTDLKNLSVILQIMR